MTGSVLIHLEHCCCVPERFVAVLSGKILSVFSVVSITNFLRREKLAAWSCY